MNPSFERLVKNLNSIGIQSGDVLAVHSSIKSMGFVDGGAKCVIDALKAVIGKEGTLMFPTFTYRTSYGDSSFSNLDTPSCVGYISEVFRKSDGVIRTNHPTHSVALWGKHQKELAAGVELDYTPMGIHSPYRKLRAFGGKILLLGCSLAHNSFMHALEEEVQLRYCWKLLSFRRRLWIQ